MIMKMFDQKEVSRRFAQLPETVQDVGLSEALGDALQQAITNAGIVGNRIKECNQQITLVLVGLSRVEDLEAYVKNDLGFDAQKTATFMTALRVGVLTPMRQALLASLGNREAVPPKEETAPVDPYLERP